jgi:hypothetical protein
MINHFLRSSQLGSLLLPTSDSPRPSQMPASDRHGPIMRIQQIDILPVWVGNTIMTCSENALAHTHSKYSSGAGITLAVATCDEKLCMVAVKW